MKILVITKFCLLFMLSSLLGQNNEFDSLYIEYNHLFKKVQVLDTLTLDQLAAIELRTSEWTANFPENHGYDIAYLKKHQKVLVVGSGRVGWLCDHLIIVEKQIVKNQAILYKVSYNYAIEHRF